MSEKQGIARCCALVEGKACGRVLDGPDDELCELHLSELDELLRPFLEAHECGIDFTLLLRLSDAADRATRKFAIKSQVTIEHTDLVEMVRTYLRTQYDIVLPTDINLELVGGIADLLVTWFGEQQLQRRAQQARE